MQIWGLVGSQVDYSVGRQQPFQLWTSDYQNIEERFRFVNISPEWLLFIMSRVKGWTTNMDPSAVHADVS